MPISWGLYKTKQDVKEQIWSKCHTPGGEEPVAGTAFEGILGTKDVHSPARGRGYLGQGRPSEASKTEQAGVDVLGNGKPLRVPQRIWGSRSPVFH